MMMRARPRFNFRDDQRSDKTTNQAESWNDPSPGLVFPSGAISRHRLRAQAEHDLRIVRPQIKKESSIMKKLILLTVFAAALANAGWRPQPVLRSLGAVCRNTGLFTRGAG
jgi:hypothetical protein